MTIDRNVRPKKSAWSSGNYGQPTINHAIARILRSSFGRQGDAAHAMCTSQSMLNRMIGGSITVTLSWLYEKPSDGRTRLEILRGCEGYAANKDAFESLLMECKPVEHKNLIHAPRMDTLEGLVICALKIRYGTLALAACELEESASSLSKFNAGKRTISARWFAREIDGRSRQEILASSLESGDPDGDEKYSALINDIVSKISGIIPVRRSRTVIKKSVKKREDGRGSQQHERKIQWHKAVAETLRAVRHSYGYEIGDLFPAEEAILTHDQYAAIEAGKKNDPELCRKAVRDIFALCKLTLHYKAALLRTGEEGEAISHLSPQPAEDATGHLTIIWAYRRLSALVPEVRADRLAA